MDTTTTQTALRPREAEAVRLANKGHTHDEVAAIMGIKPGAVRTHLSRARKFGVAIHADKTGHILAPLGENIIEWVASITPEGCDVADTIRAIITDAYHEGARHEG